MLGSVYTDARTFEPLIEERKNRRETAICRKIAVVTDSNSGITQEKARELGITVLPMPFFVDGTCYYEDINLSQADFYRLLTDDSVSVSTSQPSPGEVTDLWKKLLKEYDQIVHIPMSSGLSASCETAVSLAEDFEGKVQVVNNHRISVTQYQSVMDALTLAGAGYDAAAIRRRLETRYLRVSIYIMVDTLKYLKKGGRITPAAAMIGTVLKLKPVLQIQGDKLDAYAKVRGSSRRKRPCWKPCAGILTPGSRSASKRERCACRSPTAGAWRRRWKSGAVRWRKLFPEWKSMGICSP